MLSHDMLERLLQQALIQISIDRYHAERAVDPSCGILLLQEPQMCLLRRETISLDDFLLHFYLLIEAD